MQVLLRATCNTMMRAISILEDNGAELLETLNDIRAIEYWDNLSIANRQVLTVRFEDILNTLFSNQILVFLSKTPMVFAKSRKKGFCVQLPSCRLLQRDTEILAFFDERCTSIYDELMLSEALGIKTDSLGLRESRHFVFNGVIANSSRTLNSIKHTVPRTLFEKASSLVETITTQNGFPKNYVIDIGEFEKGNESFVDIIELNPGIIPLNTELLQNESRP